MFDCVWHLVQSILGLDDQAVLDIDRRRLTTERDSSNVSKQLMELDDGVQLLDRAEAEEVAKEQKKLKGKDLE